MEDDLALKAKKLFRALIRLKDDRARVAFLETECTGRPDLKKAVIDLWVGDQKISFHGSDLVLNSSGKTHSPTGSTIHLDGITVLTDTGVKTKCCPEIGTLIAGKYHLLEVIGEGGMGIVFRADQIAPFKRQVAIKLVKSDTTFHHALERFKIEQQALAAMKHPNIANVLDTGTTDDGSPFFVMEFFHGTPITQFCDIAQLGAHQRLQIFLDVCHAIHHAHETGLVHRDIKPANILVTRNGEQIIPKVIDFGLAKVKPTATSHKNNLTRLGMILGTLEYMSPEQARANNDQVDARSDVYSLGILLFELFTGTTPLKKRSLMKQGTQEFLQKRGMGYIPKPSLKLSASTYLSRIAADRSTHPQILIDILQEDLDAIILKALEKDPATRYQTANELANDIRNYLNGKVRNRKGRGLILAWKKWARSSNPYIIGAIFLVLPIMVAILFYWIIQIFTKAA